MKSIIIYFSQTGNTKKVAYAVYKGVSNLVEQCKIVPIKEVDPGIVNEYDLIGLGSPVWREAPPNVKRFINSIPDSPGNHVFTFNTHGALPKPYFPNVVRLLKDRGLTVIGIRDWYASVHLQSFPKPYYTDGHPDEIDLQDAEKFGRDMVKVSRRVSAGETRLIVPVPEMAKMPALAPPPNPGRSIHGEKKYDRTKCNYPQCHICLDNCPMDNIDLSVTPVKLPGACEGGCVFCELICPTGAIYMDDFQYAVDVFRSHSGDFEKELTEAEAAGLFRRLVPLDKVGWDTPYYKVYSQRPRFKIRKDDR